MNLSAAAFNNAGRELSVRRWTRYPPRIIWWWWYHGEQSKLGHFALYVTVNRKCMYWFRSILFPQFFFSLSPSVQSISIVTLPVYLCHAEIHRICFPNLFSHARRYVRDGMTRQNIQSVSANPRKVKAGAIFHKSAVGRRCEMLPWIKVHNTHTTPQNSIDIRANRIRVTYLQKTLFSIN